MDYLWLIAVVALGALGWWLSSKDDPIPPAGNDDMGW